MRTAYRIIAIFLGLVGVSRIMYASLTSFAPWISEPTPLLNVALGLAIIVAAAGLFLGYRWARWPAVAATVVIIFQDLAFLAWALAHDAEPWSVASSLVGPIVGIGVLFVLLRRWPPGRSRSGRSS